MYQRGVNWVTEFYHEGVRYKKSLGQGINKTVAREREAKFKTEVREGKHRQKSRKIKFENFAEKYLEHARLNKKPNSAKRNQVSINMLMPFFKGNLLSSIHSFQVEQYKKDRRDNGAAPATINRDVACLRNMMNMAVQWGHLQVNPVAKVKQLSEDNERMWVLTPQEEERLLDECDKRRQRKKFLRDLVEFALYSGMRQQEIFGLRWDNVHLEDQYVHVVDTKNHQNRDVPVNEVLNRILKKRKVLFDSEYVFSNIEGKRLTCCRAFDKARSEAGLARWETVDGLLVKVNFRFHDCRHTFGSRLGMNGTDLKTIMEIMGHKTARMAMRYQHPSPVHKLDAVKKLDKIQKIFTPKVTPQKVVNMKNGVITG